MAALVGRRPRALDAATPVGRYGLVTVDGSPGAVHPCLAASPEDLIVGVRRELHKAGRITSREDFAPWGDVALCYAMAGRSHDRP